MKDVVIKVAILRNLADKSFIVRDIPMVEDKMFTEKGFHYVRHHKTIWEIIKTVDLTISQKDLKTTSRFS